MSRRHSLRWAACRGVVLAALALAAACSREHAPPKAAPAPVTVVTATTRDMPVLVSAPGSVEAINSVAVKSLVDGQLLEARVRDGADVTAGPTSYEWCLLRNRWFAITMKH